MTTPNPAPRAVSHEAAVPSRAAGASPAPTGPEAGGAGGRLCVDCAFHFRRFVGGVHWCHRKAWPVVDLVTGEDDWAGQLDCQMERKLSGGCGPTGIHFIKPAPCLPCGCASEDAHAPECGR